MSIAEQLKAEGLTEGRLIGQIQLLEEFVGLPVSPTETLESKPIKDLESLHRDFHLAYENRFKQR